MIDAFFDAIDDALGTNTAVVAFALIAFVPMAYHVPQNVMEWQTWLSNTCIQLIALAIIQRGGKGSERRILAYLAESHDAHMAELSKLNKIEAAEEKILAGP
jgi:hypothetical protein